MVVVLPTPVVPMKATKLGLPSQKHFYPPTRPFLLISNTGDPEIVGHRPFEDGVRLISSIIRKQCPIHALGQYLLVQ